MLREEFDDWAVLFDPDTGHGFGTNPAGVFVWMLLDGEHAIDDLLEELRDHAKDLPEDAREHISLFVDALVAEGLAAYSDSGSYREKYSHVPLAPLTEAKPCTYEPPKLVNLSSGQSALGACSGHGSHGGSCASGAGATGCCDSGTCGTPSGGVCCSGTCGGPTCGSGTSACDSYCYTGTANSANCGYGTSPYYQCLDGSGAPTRCNCGSSGSCSNGFSVC
jgi:SynChlorMet cassette protein ScmD